MSFFFAVSQSQPPSTKRIQTDIAGARKLGADRCMGCL